MAASWVGRRQCAVGSVSRLCPPAPTRTHGSWVPQVLLNLRKQAKGAGFPSYMSVNLRPDHKAPVTKSQLQP